jgi:hypothetical protein
MAIPMRGLAMGLLAALGAACVDELEVPGPAPCDELAAPASVAIGERFAVEVACAGEVPAWFDWDFGDGSEIVRSAATAREHVYGDDVASNRSFRVRVHYRDANGDARSLEATIERR